MAHIENRTGAPHFWFEQSGPEGEPLDVLVVRGTFDFANHAEPMQFSREQQPIALGDTFAGPVATDPLRAVLAGDGDLLPYKPGTDVVILGAARAPNGIPHATWEASIRIGSLYKHLRLHGPRQFKKTLFGWRMGKAQPVTRVPIDYRLAYGGCIDIPAELTDDKSQDYVKHDGNPAGRGWLPAPESYGRLSKEARDYVARQVKAITTMDAPQIESASDPVRDPFQNASAHGFGPVARWCAPRVTHQGTYDVAWKSERYPLLPEDFDTRYYQCADPELIATPHLRGDEFVTLTGLLEEPREMRLPGWHVVAVLNRESGISTVCLPLLDTIRFDLDTATASLVWRCAFDRTDPLVEVTLGATREIRIAEAASRLAAQDEATYEL